MRPQFSLRILLLATMIVGIGMSFYARHHRWRQQRLQAMAQIYSDSGFVVFRDWNGGIRDMGLRVRAGDRVGMIYLANSNLDQRTLDLLPLLSEVKEMSFNSSVFTDRHIGELSKLPHLTRLQLNGTKITDDGLRLLSQSLQLEVLTLNNTEITDEAADTLATMKSLRRLELRDTDLSEAVVSRLQASLPQCEIQFSRRNFRQSNQGRSPWRAS